MKTILPLAVLLFTLCFFEASLNAAQALFMPKTTTEQLMESIFSYLQKYKVICDHYPHTNEGFKFPGPDNLEVTSCPSGLPKLKVLFQGSFFDPSWHGSKQGMLDGWGQEWTYASDGRTFRVEASHGYFLTEKTTPKKEGRHWDNLAPPSDDPKPRTFPGIAN
jgi:hypothetical protein